MKKNGDFNKKNNKGIIYFLLDLKLINEYLLPPTSAQAAASLQLNSSEYCAVTRTVSMDFIFLTGFL